MVAVRVVVVAESDVLLIVVEVDEVADQLAQVERLGMVFGQLGVARERGGDVGERVDLLDERVSGALHLLWCGGTLFDIALQQLDAEPHRGERVLDLMSHLSGHPAPGGFSGGAPQFVGFLLQSVNELVIVIDQLPDLVVAVPFQFFVRCVEFHLGHLLRQLQQRVGQLSGTAQHQIQDDENDQQHDVDVGQHIFQKIGMQSALIGKIRRVEVSQIVAVLVLNGNVGRLEGNLADVLVVDVIQ